MARKSYPTDLTDMEWEILAPLIPAAKEGGHPRTTDMREICNAIYYHLKTGCQTKCVSEARRRHRGRQSLS
jgi:putative transposase